VGEIAYASWLKRVVTNLSINALQRTKRPGTLPEFSNDPALHSSDGPGASSETTESMQKLRAALDRLDPAKRTILMLRASEQLSYEEIAAHLGVPLGTVMSRLNRARTALIEELERGVSEDKEPDVFPFRRYREA
jgi:RNA polymerase sigma-70 factor (ECF subfamily)